MILSARNGCDIIVYCLLALCLMEDGEVQQGTLVWRAVYGRNDAQMLIL